MKNISIFYFSGTGNTWWAAGRLSDNLTTLGYKSERISIEQPNDKLFLKIKNSDIVFLTYPVYGSDRPEIVKDFINSLPERQIPFGIVCTQMGFSGDGAWLEHEIIERKGYSINWAVHLTMPNNISIPGFPFRYSNDYPRLDKILSKTSIKIKKIADAVSTNTKMIQGSSTFSNLLGLMQRRPYRRMYPSIKNLLKFNDAKCIKCGMCVSLCPVENIHLTTEGFPEFSDRCNLCLRCYNFCPVFAVKYSNKDFKPKGNSCDIPYRGPVINFDPSVLKE
jgi:ferredoxin/flavodoxin